MSPGTLVDGVLDDGTLTDGALDEGVLLDGLVVDGMLDVGAVLDGILDDGTLDDGMLVGVVLVGVVLVGVDTVGVGDGVTTEMQAGSPACSSSSQLPRTSPGTPLSSGDPASRDAARAGTASVSVAQPAMIQIRCRFMVNSSLWGTSPSSQFPQARHQWTMVLRPSRWNRRGG